VRLHAKFRLGEPRPCLEPWLRVDLRYDFFEQDQLREGTDSVSRGSFTYPNEREVQRYTINRNATLAVDYGINSKWGMNVALPWFDRSHATIAEDDTDISTSHDRGIGDVRVMGRYLGLDAQHHTGLEFGLKLPTGKFDSPFRSGPQEGETLRPRLAARHRHHRCAARHLQIRRPGAGLGLLRARAAATAARFARRIQTRAGVNMNFGVRYTGFGAIEPQLQINARVEKRETARTPTSKTAAQRWCT